MVPLQYVLPDASDGTKLVLNANIFMRERNSVDRVTAINHQLTPAVLIEWKGIRRETDCDLLRSNNSWVQPIFDLDAIGHRTPDP